MTVLNFDSGDGREGKDTYSQLWLEPPRRIERVPNRKIHSLLIQIMLKNDEASLELRRRGQDLLECRERFGAVDGAARNAPVCSGRVSKMFSSRMEAGG